MPSPVSLPLATPLQLEKHTSPTLRPKTVAPLHTLPRRPTVSTRTLSSPPSSPMSKSRDMATCLHVPRGGDVLTPPTTPTKVRKSSSADRLLEKRLITPGGTEDGDSEMTLFTPVGPHGRGIQRQEEVVPVPPDKPFEFTPLFIPVPGPANRPQEYGRGVWSIVFKATLSRTILPSPPSSPDTSYSRHSQLLAVKSPLHRGAMPVLRAEATLLTYLTALPSSISRIVPFHGYHTPTSSIVLSAIPLTLVTYITTASSHARANFSTRTMFDPVLGTSAWLSLAHQLISTLCWLHNTASVVHADIKPGNILLRPTSNANTQFPYDALLTDFSSSFHCTSAPVPSSLALTTSFAAPELLTKNSTVAPTKSSDVYALACTLLAAATGDALIYPTQYEIQRLAMAREGKPLEFVRMVNQGTRARKGGVVERVVEEAVGKEPTSRIEAGRWLEKAEKILREMGIEILNESRL